MSDSDGFTIEDFLSLLARRARIMLIVAVSVAFVGWYLSLNMPVIYEAEMVLSLDHGKTILGWDGQRSQSDPYMGGYENDLVVTQRDILMSRGVLVTGLSASGLANGTAYLSSTDPVALLKTRLTALTSRDTWSLTLRLRDEDPKRAELGLAAIADAYFSSQQARDSAKTGDALRILEAQVDEATSRLAQTRAAESDFRDRRGIVSSNSEENPPASRLRELIAERSILEAPLAAAEAIEIQIAFARVIKDPSARRAAMVTVDAIGSNQLVVELQRQLLVAQAQVAQFGVKYLEKHPRMIEANAQVVDRTLQLDTAITQAEQLAASNLARKKDQFKLITSQIDRVHADLAEYRRQLVELQALSDRTKAEENIHSKLLERLKEEQAAARVQRRYLTISSVPSSGNAPVSASRTVVVLLCLTSGMIVGIIAGIAADMVDQKAHRGHFSHSRKLAPFALLPQAAGMRPVCEEFEGMGGASAEFVEAFRTLRAALLLGRTGQEGCRVIAVTSPKPGEGKTTVVARLGLALANSGLKVLIVDGDLRNPSLSREFPSTSASGFAELLLGEPGISAEASGWLNLEIIHAGQPTENPAELLSSHCLPEWLAQCRGSYDYILIDTPPVLVAADALILGQGADDILLVVREGFTSKAEITSALAQLNPFAERMRGVVLNGTQVNQALYYKNNSVAT